LMRVIAYATASLLGSKSFSQRERGNPNGGIHRQPCRRPLRTAGEKKNCLGEETHACALDACLLACAGACSRRDQSPSKPGPLTTP
jgi:hypothetical protein